MKKILLFLMIISLGYSCDDDSSGGDSPVIIQGQGTFEAYVGVQFSSQIIATDEDSSTLSFSFESDIENISTRTHPPQLIAAGAKSVYFQWTPLASDIGEHHVDIIVSDGKNQAIAAMVINVKSTTGTNVYPVFINPLGSGTTLDLSSSSCVDVEIEVEDSDSTQMDIYIEDPIIEGYELQHDPGEFTASFSWCPTDKQINQSDRYTLNLAANDREDHITRKRYVIILRRDLENNCPGDAPVISFTEPDAMETLSDITLQFGVTDDLGVASAPVVYYRTTPPADTLNPDFSTFIPISASKISGTVTDGIYTVTIPNPVVNLNPGDKSTIYYAIEAEDNDDAEGSCDHRTTMPLSGTYNLNITYPEGTVTGYPICTPCQTDNQCGGSNDACVYLNSTYYCLQDCHDDPAVCPENTTCSDTAFSGTSGINRKQCVPVTGTCVSSNCIDDDEEDNDYPSAFLPETSSGQINDLMMCSDPDTGYADEDWFRFSLDETTLGLFEIFFQHSDGDLDISLSDLDGNEIGYSFSVTDNESIVECLPSGDYFLQVVGWNNNLNVPYSLNVELLSGGCCTDDDLESNDNYMEALPVVSDDTISGLSICSGDQDWFSIDVDAGQTIWVDMVFEQNNDLQDLDVYIVDTDGTTILTPCCDPDNGQSSTSNEELTFQAPESGTYYIFVEGFDDAQNTYDVAFYVFDL
ncbi:MAG: PPC domain-containing protein [Deltaproteobacteria bacterium]|nr:PPC domain-containing protein [Deltaproteobacteria bacterium]